MHPGEEALLRFFRTEHLPSGPLRDTSIKFKLLAENLIDTLPSSAEKTAGLRKLLEAKDCFVRAALDLQPPTSTP